MIMPYIHLRTSRVLGEEDLHALQKIIVEDLARYLSKPPARCMVQIDAGQCLLMGDGAADCAFVEVLVRGRFDIAVKDAFGTAFLEDVAAGLALTPERVYLYLQETHDGEVTGTIYISGQR